MFSFQIEQRREPEGFVNFFFSQEKICDAYMIERCSVLLEKSHEELAISSAWALIQKMKEG
jgi:hypothetical protein